MYISNKDVIGCVAGIIYKMHPYHKPDNLDIIIDKIDKYFDIKDKSNNNLKLISFKDWNEVNKWLKEFLMGIKEFRQLNISRKLKDACIQNIAYELSVLKEASEDCFICNYAKEYGSMEPGDHDLCKTCSCNPEIKFNRIPHPMSLKPHNQWTEEEKEKYKL